MIHVPLVLAQLLDEEVIDGLVSEGVRVFEVQAVTSSRDDHRGDVRPGEGFLLLSRDAATARGAVVTAATAERHIPLASDDKYWTSEGIRDS